MPAIMSPLAWACGVQGAALSVVALSAAVPTASSSYVLARRLGGDAPLMSVIITTQTVLARVSLPVVLLLAGAVSAAPANGLSTGDSGRPGSDGRYSRDAC